MISFEEDILCGLEICPQAPVVDYLPSLAEGSILVLLVVPLPVRVVGYILAQVVDYTLARVVGYIPARVADSILDRAAGYILVRVVGYIPAQVVGYIPARVVGYIPGPMTIHICLIGHQESTYYNT